MICAAPPCSIRFVSKSRKGRIYCSIRCQSRAEYHRNRQKHLLQKKEYHKRVSAIRNAKARRYRATHRLQSNQTSANWHKSHPEQSAQMGVRRRMLLYSTPVVVSLTKSEWLLIKRAFNHRCAYCGRGRKLTQDHILPISRGGTHTLDNVVPACQPCNSKKGSLTADEYRERE